MKQGINNDGRAVHKKYAATLCNEAADVDGKEMASNDNSNAIDSDTVDEMGLSSSDDDEETTSKNSSLGYLIKC